MKNSKPISWILVFVFVCILTTLQVRKRWDAITGLLSSAKGQSTDVDQESQWNGRLVQIERKKGMHDLFKREAAMKGGEHFKPLKVYMEFPGVDSPRPRSLADASLSDSTRIIGVECEGDAFAVVEEEMKEPGSNVINLSIQNKKSISITYSHLANCVRVLSSDGPGLIPLGVGGLDIENEMVLLHDGQRYGQTSKDIPLADHQFLRTSLGKWKETHPDTKVIVTLRWQAEKVTDG